MMAQHFNINSLPQESDSLLSRSRSKRRYIAVNELERAALLELIDSKQITIKAAAEELNIHYSTAKNIVKLFRKYGRLHRLPKRQCHLSKGEGEAIDLKRMKLFELQEGRISQEEENALSVSSAASFGIRNSLPPLYAPTPLRFPPNTPTSSLLNPAAYSHLIMKM